MSLEALGILSLLFLRTGQTLEARRKLPSAGKNDTQVGTMENEKAPPGLAPLGSGRVRPVLPREGDAAGNHSGDVDSHEDPQA